MNDIDIIKVLECCSHPGGHCEECVLQSNLHGECIETMAKDALDLIQRQQVEIKCLKTGIDDLDCRLSMVDGIIVPPCKVDDVVYILDQEYENEPLKVVPLLVKYIHVDSTRRFVHAERAKLSAYLPFDLFGKIVFTSYEEAEAVLKNGSACNNCAYSELDEFGCCNPSCENCENYPTESEVSAE